MQREFFERYIPRSQKRKKNEGGTVKIVGGVRGGIRGSKNSLSIIEFGRAIFILSDPPPILAKRQVAKTFRERHTRHIPLRVIENKAYDIDPFDEYLRRRYRVVIIASISQIENVHPLKMDEI